MRSALSPKLSTLFGSAREPPDECQDDRGQAEQETEDRKRGMSLTWGEAFEPTDGAHPHAGDDRSDERRVPEQAPHFSAALSPEPLALRDRVIPHDPLRDAAGFVAALTLDGGLPDDLDTAPRAARLLDCGWREASADSGTARDR